MSGLEIVARSDCAVATCAVEIGPARIPRAAEVSWSDGSDGSATMLVQERAKHLASTTAASARPSGKCTPVRQASAGATRKSQQDCLVETRLHAMVGPMRFASRADTPPPRG